MPRKTLPRDNINWRIPENGTLSRQIYNLCVLGHTPAEIAAALNMKVLNVRVLKHRFVHADRTNAWARKEGAR